MCLSSTSAPTSPRSPGSLASWLPAESHPSASGHSCFLGLQGPWTSGTCFPERVLRSSSCPLHSAPQPLLSLRISQWPFGHGGPWPAVESRASGYRTWGSSPPPFHPESLTKGPYWTGDTVLWGCECRKRPACLAEVLGHIIKGSWLQGSGRRYTCQLAERVLGPPPSHGQAPCNGSQAPTTPPQPQPPS